MIHGIDSFLTFWRNWMFVSFGLGVIGVLVLIYVQQAKPNKKRKPIITGVLLIIQLIGTWVLGFGLVWTVQLSARNALKNFLDQPNIEVRINGRTLPKSESNGILEELRKIENYMAHHSHPTDQLTIELTSNNQTFPLSLERDSEIPTEYWIFSNKYDVTSSNEIGRIQTAIFN